MRVTSPRLQLSLLTSAVALTVGIIVIYNSQGDGPQLAAANANTVQPAVQPVAAVTPAANPAPAAPPATTPPPKPVDPSDEFFEKGIIPNIKIVITAEEMQRLRQDQRRFVKCQIIENGNVTYKKVEVKLKGAAGSFRNLDDRPALTLKMTKKGEKFHGLDKFHLNNSVQDDSYFSELLCSQLCREAGVPAARATHARVWINDRDLGFYGLKEGFDEEFLARNYPDKGKGVLYDGGFCQDIDANLEKDEGENPDNRDDLKALIAACREPDEKKRYALIDERLDVDAFLKFVAMELMMSHWDGYAQNRNNYRVYFRADNKKAYFMPHGMDQMFGDPNFGVFHVPGPIVTSAVLNNPAWRTRYREIVRQILPLFDPEKLNAKLETSHKRMRPVLASMGEDRAKHLDNKLNEWKGRVANRQKGIIAQFPPEPIPFSKEGVALIDKWEAVPAGDAKLEQKEVDGKKVLLIETGPSKQCTGSFRSTVRLGKGSYKFEAKVKPNGVASIAAPSGGGAGVRVSGATRESKAEGTADWQTVHYNFDVAEELKEVTLVTELQATAGSAIFDLASIRIIKVK